MKSKEERLKDIVDIAMSVVALGAREYMARHNMNANHEVLAECCKSWLKIQLPIAVQDAQEAFDCGMSQVAAATFEASLIQAGIEAAKEAALPSAQFDLVNAKQFAVSVSACGATSSAACGSNGAETGNSKS